MSRIVIVHWDARGAEERARILRAAGHDARGHWETDVRTLRAIRDDPPDLFVIDLARLPSHGRDVALWLRLQKRTRCIPIVFVEGDPAKTEPVRDRLPDAVYTPWSRIRGAVRHALRHPPSDPVVHRPMSAYVGVPLAKKLGIKAGSVVVLLGAPAGFEPELGRLPEGVVLRRAARGRADVVLLFVSRRREMKRRFGVAASSLKDGGRLWICWPKRASGAKADFAQNEVRAFGIAAGFVDFKIAAIDQTWSGLCFVRRRRARAR